MLFGLLTFLVAITISCVAIYYSVAGLVAIFAAAAVPIIIMGTALEVGKLVTAVWLHRYWTRATWWLKTYLSIAVVVLMFITSMGIFGFLSKAHVEQNLASDTVTSRIEILEGKILAEEKYIERQNQVLSRIQNKDDSGVNRFNQDIAIEQKKIDDAYARIQVLDADVEAFTSRNKGFGGTGRVKQGLELREKQGPEREALMLQIEKASQKIDELRAKNDASLDGIEVQIQIAEKNIFDATGRIDQHLLAIEPLKGQIMKLESEVGPIRYIAEFVYGEEADKNLLEEAVRWVIITIIFVFDPLAVLLLIASQYTFRWRYIDAGGKLTPPAPKNPPAPKTPPQVPPAPSGKQKLSEIVDKKEETKKINKPIKLSDISNAKPVPQPKTSPGRIKPDFTEVIEPEKTTHEMLMEGFEKEQKEREAEEQKEREAEEQKEKFKQREEDEKKALEEVARKAKEEELAQQVKEIKTTLENIEPKTLRPGLTSAGLTLGGQKPKEVEPPMPLDQWNKMIEEAEKEVAKEEPKKKTSNYIMRAETGDKQVKVKDRLVTETDQK